MGLVCRIPLPLWEDRALRLVPSSAWRREHQVPQRLPGGMGCSDKSRCGRWRRGRSRAGGCGKVAEDTETSGGGRSPARGLRATRALRGSGKEEPAAGAPQGAGALLGGTGRGFFSREQNPERNLSSPGCTALRSFLRLVLQGTCVSGCGPCVCRLRAQASVRGAEARRTQPSVRQAVKTRVRLKTLCL